MSRARLEIVGLADLMAAMRNLPDHLASEAGRIVQARGARAAETIRSNYRAHSVTGTLEGSVDLRPREVGRYGAGVIVRARARHAHLFERGTVGRAYRGWSRGVMPAAPRQHQFVPVLEGERREMLEDFAELLEREGLEVTRRG
jgi:hypothetical protein